MDACALQDNPRQSRALACLTCLTGLFPVGTMFYLRGPGEQQAQQLTPPASFDIAGRGEEKPGFSVSCLCWLLSAREITSKGLSNFLSHPRKRERVEDLPRPCSAFVVSCGSPFSHQQGCVPLIGKKKLKSHLLQG